jgi:thiosulfate dehydrogenase [quinone] large subunit
VQQYKKQTTNLSLLGGRLQITALFLLRMIIGWHFLYEGLFKIFTPGWTSKGYLLTSDWIFSGIFRAMAQSSGLLSVIDIINMALLTLVGVSLILGIYSRVASLAGAFLIMLYYVPIRHLLPVWWHLCRSKVII